MMSPWRRHGWGALWECERPERETELVEHEKLVGTPAAQSPATTASQHQVFVTGDILNAALKLQLAAEDEGRAGEII